MKIYSASEMEIDERLNLDKRASKIAFCRNFHLKSETGWPPKFTDLQDELRDGLEKRFWESFDDGVDRSNLPQWKLSGSHSWFYFGAELEPSERLIVEMNVEILGDKLLGIILDHLEKHHSKYCVIAAMFSGIKWKDYLGRFVINLEEIAVEESLVETWNQKVRFLEIEPR